MPASAQTTEITPSLKQGEHVLLVGPTGSGKSFLGDRFLRSYPYTVVLDSKDELHWKGFLRTKKLDAVRYLDASHIIYVPEHRNLIESADTLFELVYTQRGWTVYVDEVYSLGLGMSVPPSFNKLLTRGRSRGITVWTGTQRPKWMPLFCFTESKHYFLFRVTSEDDIRTIARQASPEIATRIKSLQKYGFIYYNKEDDIAHVSAPLRR